MRIELDPDLASRLYTAARQLGRDPAQCALSAILAFVTDCEDAARMRTQLGGGDWVRTENQPD
ncbi:conserved protein of unknown function [Magnetospirillum sp. XM-1]|uniref:hypothetical protein n=1 Tax=Magnetospirillum sp. XM-1 TaxID=1663591 RepID=UPI00073DFD4E|nr:hypothetical protein [Magnetospirillum sp. XM-1]CUW38173.1 conserved protein of unknown function [Magnetospirillum sp. XM-1]